MMMTQPSKSNNWVAPRCNRNPWRVYANEHFVKLDVRSAADVSA